MRREIIKDYIMAIYYVLYFILGVMEKHMKSMRHSFLNLNSSLEIKTQSIRDR